MLYTSCCILHSPCACTYSACFSGSVYSYIHLMSTTQLDRFRSPTMPCILLYSYLYIYRKIAASCTTRLARSLIIITGAAHTVIPIQRQHAHKMATSLLHFIQCTRDRYRRKMSLASENAEEEETRSSRRRGRDRARRAAQSSQATKNCLGSVARERRVRDRRKKRLDSESALEKETRLSSEMLNK